MSEAVRVSILELLQELLDSSEVREKPYSHSSLGNEMSHMKMW